MKEFSAQTGGRYTYVDDIVNLQELSLAFTSIFDDCDNFIISGCEISGTSISSGYVYIAGKIRYFSGISNITTWPQFIYESNSIEMVAYASGSDKVGRNVYGCAIASSVPTTLDPLTGEVPAFIQLTEQGGKRMNDALFGKYALLLQSAAGSQSVNDIVTFNKEIAINGILKAYNRIVLTQGVAQCQMYYENNKLIIQSRVSTGTIYRLITNNENGWEFYVDDTLCCTINHNRIGTSFPITMKECVAGNISIQQSNIINKGHASDSACININMTGFNNGTFYFRNTFIGNGKGVAIITVIGSTKKVQIDGSLFINSNTVDSLSLKKNTIIDWLNGANTRIAYVGYNESNILEIKNDVASIKITAKDYVDLLPAIKEHGILLSEKYVPRNELQGLIANKAEASLVYTKTQSDNKYATKNGGLSQFTSTHSTTELRNQIDAAGKTDLDDYPKKTKLLSDMATTESEKDAIRQNINAEKRLKDTGWITVIDGVFARQIGDIVCIHGKVEVAPSMFTLPDTIQPPKHDTVFNIASSKSINQGQGTYSVTYQHCTLKIAAGQRTCTRTNNRYMDGETVPISMTYMV